MYMIMGLWTCITFMGLQRLLEIFNAHTHSLTACNNILFLRVTNKQTNQKNDDDDDDDDSNKKRER